MNCGVPSTVPVAVADSFQSRAMPKSITNGRSAPSAPRSTMMFDGLRSRWMSPARWASWTPSAAPRITSAFCS